MKPNLRAVRENDPEPTKAEIYHARIAQSHREWHGPNGEPWKPIQTEATKPLCVDEVLSKYRIIAESEVGWFRKFLRWIRF